MALAPFFVRLLPGLAVAEHFRAPCVPLDVATPYQSTWSCCFGGCWSKKYVGTSSEEMDSKLMM